MLKTLTLKKFLQNKIDNSVNIISFRGNEVNEKLRKQNKEM